MPHSKPASITQGVVGRGGGAKYFLRGHVIELQMCTKAPKEVQKTLHMASSKMHRTQVELKNLRFVALIDFEDSSGSGR